MKFCLRFVQRTYVTRKGFPNEYTLTHIISIFQDEVVDLHRKGKPQKGKKDLRNGQEKERYWKRQGRGDKEKSMRIVLQGRIGEDR